MNSELLNIINNALNEKGPAATAIAPDRGSPNPEQDRNMNDKTNNTASDESPRPIKLQLLDLQNGVDAALSLARGLELAAEGLHAPNEKSGMCELVVILVERLNDLRDDVNGVREALA